MTIDRVIAALQRITHLNNWGMRQGYPELFDIQEQKEVLESVFRIRLSVRSRVAEMRGLACPIKKPGD